MPQKLDAPAERNGSTASVRASFVSIVLPCLNEEEAVGLTVLDAVEGLRSAALPGEVIVVDNGSTDRSVEVARAAGARVIREERPGAGAAILAGFQSAQGDVVVMADADRTYDLKNVGLLVRTLENGADMVVAERLSRVEDGAMPFLHRHLGTPILTWLVNWMTGMSIRDSQSGYRAFWRASLPALNFRTPGFEHCSEQLIRAAQLGWDVREVPLPYGHRIGDSKLNTWEAGWHHLRTILLMAPHLSLLTPGVALSVLGFVLCLVSLIAPSGLSLGSVRWLPLFLGPTLLIIGGQAAYVGALAAHGSDLTPVSVRKRLSFLGRRDAVDFVLTRFAALAILGLLIEVALAVLWLSGQSGAALIGIAGLAQAMIVVGIGGIATTFGVDFARDSLGL